MTLDLTPRVTAPSVVDDPLGYYTWHLKRHPEMYLGFRRLADQYRAVDPQKRMSAYMICHVIRFESGLGATDDQFQVNNAVAVLYARLYRRERPDVNLELRTSVLDALTDAEWDALLALLPEEKRREY